MADPVPYAQPEAYDAQGQPVAPELVGAAVAKGEAFFKKGTKVYARNPEGALVTIAPEDVGREGYTVLSGDQVNAAWNEKQYGSGAANKIKAGAAGVARGLTLGASDAVLAGVGGDDTRKALEGLRSANPYTSGAGEIVGAVAPLLASGGSAGAAMAGAKGASLGAKVAGGASTALRTAGAAPRAAAALGHTVEHGVARGLASLGVKGTGTLGKAATGALKTAASGMTEGAIYGAAHAANDAVLKGDAITAEKIVAGIGHGALFGGALGGALGAAGPLVSGAVSKLKPGKETLEKIAQEQALKSVARGSDIRRIAGKATGEAAEARLAATADDLLNYEFKSGPLKGERAFVPGRNVDELLERISYAKEELGAAIGGTKKELSERMLATGDGPDVGEFLRRVDEKIISPLMKSKSPGAMSKARSVQKQLSIIREEHMLAQAGGDALDQMGLANAKFLKSGMRDMADVRSAYAGATREEVQAIALGKMPTKSGGKAFEPVRVDIFPDGTISLGDGRHRLMGAQEAGADDILAKVQTWNEAGDIVSETIRPISIQPRTGPRPGPSFEELDAFRMRLDEIVYPQASGAGGLPPAPPKAVKYLEQTRNTLQDYLKEKASTFLAKTGDDPNAYNELNRQFSSFRKLEQIAGKNANQSLGNRSVSPSDHALGLASFMSALATGNVGAVGSMAFGGAAAMANKLLRERGNSMVAHWAKRAAQMDEGIEHAAKRLAGHKLDVKAPTLAGTHQAEAAYAANPRPVVAAAMQSEGLRDSYQKTSDRIRELARPEMAAQHVSSLLPEVSAGYPRVGSAVSAKLLGIYQQLAARLPQSHVDVGQTLTPLAVKQRVTPMAMRSFMSSVRGALEPESVIADLGDGIVDRDAIASLKEAHPETFQQLRSKVADYVEQNEEELPYKRRVMLSLTFDFTGDSSLEPARMKGLQDAAQAVSAGADMPQEGMPKPKRADPGKSKLGSSFSTPSDSAFGGE
jgi:hypothetical protein